MSQGGMAALKPGEMLRPYRIDAQIGADERLASARATRVRAHRAIG